MKLWNDTKQWLTKRMSDETENKYNGWTNWDTWEVNNWINNDEGTYNRCIKLDETDLANYWECKQMNPEVELEKVNWREIMLALDE